MFCVLLACCFVGACAPPLSFCTTFAADPAIVALNMLQMVALEELRGAPLLASLAGVRLLVQSTHSEHMDWQGARDNGLTTAKITGEVNFIWEELVTMG